jgi:hypothetical protein
MQQSRRWGTTKQVAEHTHQSESKFEKMRVIGDGPPFYKFGKAVLYDLNEVDDWIASQRRESTSSDGPSEIMAPIDRRHGDQLAPTRGAGAGKS